MIPGIKSEFRKIFTIRSTYILLGLAFVYMVFYDFYVIGFKQSTNAASKFGGIASGNVHFLMTEVTRAGGIAAPVLFMSIIAVMLMAHEYRYNTIMYTLTSSNSRNKTLLSKLIAVTVFSSAFAILVMLFAPLLALAGLHAHHVVLAHQVFYFKQFFWRVLFYAWSYAVIGLLLAVFFRNIVASIAAIFLLPVTIEPLIGLLLNTNQQQYLPFTALMASLNNGILLYDPALISAERSALVALAYIVVGWAVAWFLFLRRDAN